MNRDNRRFPTAVSQPTTSETIFSWVFYALLVATFLFAIGAFGQTLEAPLPPPSITAPPGLEWLGALIDWLSSVPKVGTFVVNAMKYVGAASAVFTAISLAITTVLKVPALVARWAGAANLAAKIEAFAAKLKPWTDYFSIFNVQK